MGVCNGNKYKHHSLLCYCGKSEEASVEEAVLEQAPVSEAEPVEQLSVSETELEEEEASADGAKFVGCYKDQKDRDMPNKFANFKLGERETCFDKCRSEGFQFAGLQWKGQCFCGNSYGSYGEGEKCDCSRGSKMFGFWEQCIYEVNDYVLGQSDDEEEEEQPCGERTELSMLQGLRQWFDGLAASGEISAEQRSWISDLEKKAGELHI